MLDKIPLATELTTKMPCSAPKTLSLASRFREGAHVNLIACDSDVSYAAQGDDMLSLLSAVFLAGARSACTTLWKVTSGSAGDWIELMIKE